MDLIMHRVTEERGLIESSVARALAEGGVYSLLAWVLARNASRGFYEAVGGELLGSQHIVIGGARLEEVAYGWLRLHSLG